MKHDAGGSPAGAELLLEVKGSHFPGEHAAGPVHLHVYRDHLTTDQRVGVHKRHARAAIADLTGVGIEREPTGFLLFFDTKDHQEIRVPGLSATNAQEARQTVQRLMAAHAKEVSDAARAAAAVPAAPASKRGIDDELRHLNALRAAGTISDAEFNHRKTDLFDAMRHTRGRNGGHGHHA